MFRKLSLLTQKKVFPKGTEVAKGAFIGNFPTDGASLDPSHFHNGVPYMTPALLLSDASEFLSTYDVGAVPVLTQDTKKLIGMISERDIARKLKTMAPNTTVSDVMSRTVITCPPGLSLTEALLKMDKHNFRHLPVVDPATGDVVGLLSMRDIVHQQLHHGVQEVDAFMSWVTKMSS